MGVETAAALFGAWLGGALGAIDVRDAAPRALRRTVTEAPAGKALRLELAPGGGAVVRPRRR